ncbi:MAG: class I SAM-dependent methyltransferase [Phycisphaerales bacterium]|nr:class I SAM-dependent methyltransferase [Phycisphaerales bacterium]
MAANDREPFVFECAGACPCCDRDVSFRARYDWFRDHLLCSSCGSIPRERALMLTLKRWYPDWPTLAIHESSPGYRGASVRLARDCARYTGTHFAPGVPPGAPVPGTAWTCQDLERQTFPDASFDLVITQDVFEHVLDPASAFREIARTLRPGGAHVFTTPLVNKHKPSQVWASRADDGSVVHHHEPEYHGNPIDKKGSLVTMHWGYDIAEHVHAACGLSTTLVHIDDLSHGVRAEYIEVCVTRKPA